MNGQRMIDVLVQLKHILNSFERQGKDKDDPEGSRYICISDTLVKMMSDNIDRALFGEIDDN